MYQYKQTPAGAEHPPVKIKEEYIMKKKFFSTALLILMIAALMIFAAGCGSESDNTADDSAARIAELEQENAALREQLDLLTAQLDLAKENVSLQDWAMEAKAWSDGNGATVSFTASPVNYVDGMKAALSIRMGDLEAESTNCVWDGAAFTGSVELSAADGYSYYCILVNPDGSQDEIELNSPENVTNDMLVYLGSSLSSYANLVVEDWAVANSSLTLKSGYVHAQMPQLSFNDAAPEITKSSLVLKLNNEEVSRKDLALEPGEGSGSYEATLNGQSFAMPTVQDDYQLDLWLELALNTGSTVTVSGGSWYSSNGELQLVVG